MAGMNNMLSQMLSGGANPFAAMLGGGAPPPPRKGKNKATKKISK
jgi:hypothetical protein